MTTDSFPDQPNNVTFSTRQTDNPWPSREKDRQDAQALVAQMSLEEKLGLVSVQMGYGPGAPSEAVGSAAYNPGVPRLGIPAWNESDASLGVTNPMKSRGEQPQTAFPSANALAATFDRELAFEQGQALGSESRTAGMSVQLAGGMNLIREPRGGRNFEYPSEDVLLTGMLAGAAVRGIQSQGVISTVKHFALNAQETGRVMMSSDLAEPELRESDLLAFEIAIEHSQPRAIMVGYNQLNGLYSSESPWLLNTVLKGDWGYDGFVMSDWGGTHSTVHAANGGLDRQSGVQLDTKPFFTDALAQAVRDGKVSEARLDDMAARIIAALISVGALEQERESHRLSDEDGRAHATVAKRIAEEAIVLLRNENEALPLSSDLKRLVVLGKSADVGVLAGGGSSAVQPPASSAIVGSRIAQLELPKVHHHPSPVSQLQKALPNTKVEYFDVSADDVDKHVNDDDTVVVFAERWVTEGSDRPDLNLDDGADELIAAAANAARRVIVVLETPGAVLMPWADDVEAIVEAWYPGAEGAAAIAAVLTGAVNPSGRLPMTFPRSVDHLPRHEVTDPATTTSNPGAPRVGEFPHIDYNIEGADIGYRWFEREARDPLYWFGFGLDYASVTYESAEISLNADGFPQATLTVHNTSDRTAVAVPQLYVSPPERPFRLGGWGRIELQPGERKRVTIAADDPRVYATYQVDDPGFNLAEGDYGVRVATSASPQDLLSSASVVLESKRLA